MKSLSKALCALLVVSSFGSASAIFKDPAGEKPSKIEKRYTKSPTQSHPMIRAKLTYHERLAKHHRREAARLQKQAARHLKLADYHEKLAEKDAAQEQK
jgi:hypothetical protein